jgi:DNA-binding NtrC family response regulator
VEQVTLEQWYRAHEAAKRVAQEKGEPEPAVVLQVPVGTTLKMVEDNLIVATLSYLGGHKTKTAQMLGISKKTLYNKLRDLNFTP